MLSCHAPSIRAYKLISVVTLENIASTETFRETCYREGSSSLEANGSRGSYCRPNRIMVAATSITTNRSLQNNSFMRHSAALSQLSS